METHKTKQIEISTKESDGVVANLINEINQMKSYSKADEQMKSENITNEEYNMGENKKCNILCLGSLVVAAISFYILVNLVIHVLTLL